MRHWMGAATVIFFSLLLAGCGDGGGGGDGGGDGGGGGTNAADFANRSFLFPADQELFDPGEPLFGQDVIVTVGDFDGDTAAITLVGATDGSILGGTITLGSCTLTATFQQAAGQELEVVDPGDEDAVVVLDPCRVRSDNTLRIVDDEGEEFISEPATDPVVVFDLTVPLSTANQVEAPEALYDRPETGSAQLTLFEGNLLSYTLAVNDLQDGDSLTIAHIHSGGVVANGPPFITLAGVPNQDARPVNPEFAEGATGITASVALTNDEVTALTNASNDYYVNVHSNDFSGGLVRGQLRETIDLAFNVFLSPANIVPPIVGRPESGIATLRLLDDDTLAYRLTANDLAATDTLTNAHIHFGASDENMGIFLTLVGQPTDPRTADVQFALIDGSTDDFVATSEMLLTEQADPPEVTTLSDPAQPLYVQIHSVEEAPGLLRGQIRDAVVGNTPPVADAGPDQNVQVGALITLDGTGSSDADNDPLTYAWSFTSRPTGSTAALDDPTSDMPTFTADVAGDYVIQLIVNDGSVDSAPDSVTITASVTPPENTPPVADAGPDQSVQVGELVTLNGSGSSDDDGDPLTFAWTFTSMPAGSNATLSEPDDDTPTFTPDVEGDYVAQLIVNDGTESSDPATTTVTATLDGEAIYVAGGCDVCHGADGSGVASFPNIQGATPQKIRNASNTVSAHDVIADWTDFEVEAVSDFLATFVVSLSNDVQPIFDGNCVSNCHEAGGSGGSGTGVNLNLNSAATSFQNLVDVPSTLTQGGTRVIPGDSANSVLFLRVSGTSAGIRMPLGGAPLSAGDQNLIQDWIDQGAPNN